MTSTTSKQNVPPAVRPAPGPWVATAPDGSVITAPYLLGRPSDIPSGPFAPAGLPRAKRRLRADVVVFGAAGLVGVMAVVAPFLVLWRYGFDDGLVGAQTIVNGWGSVSAHPASFATSHSHDTNYGLPLVLAAAFLLAGATTFAITRRAVVATLPTTVGASLAAGTALLLALDRGGRDSATTGSDSWAVGPGFWLIAAAGGLGVAVALAAAVLAAFDLRVGAPTPAESFSPAPYPTDPAWIAPPSPAWIAPPTPAWIAPPTPPWYAPADPARFTPPWAP